jgi:glycosyltransferase involved in cell wall biosynthesis
MGNKPAHIICLCCGIGFPNGMATSVRMRLMGQAYITAGGKFSVFHVGGSISPGNQAHGVEKGINYTYFPHTARRPSGRLKRVMQNMMGLVQAINHINRIAQNERVMVYSFLTNKDIYTLFIHAPVIIELNEWFTTLSRRICRYLVSFKAVGYVVISSSIKQRLLKYRSTIRTVEIPILLDKNEIKMGNKKALDHDYLMWCGSAERKGLKDVLFILEAYSKLDKTVCTVDLVLCGYFPESSVRLIQHKMEQLSLSKNSVHIRGFVDKDCLQALILNASALLLPMWNEERSVCRFPTKLGEYLLSGNPIITAPCGELVNYCGKEEVFYYEVGSTDSFRLCIEEILKDKMRAQEMGQKGKRVAEEAFHYEQYSEALFSFINGYE